MLLYTLIDIISYLIQIVQVVVIVQFVMSLLLSFNVISFQNEFVASLWRALNAAANGDAATVMRLVPRAREALRVAPERLRFALTFVLAEAMGDDIFEYIIGVAILIYEIDPGK